MQRYYLLPALGWMVASCAPGQIALGQVQTTSTQALITYTVPDQNPCTVEISESPTYRPLVNDVDPVKFYGASLDNRPGTTQVGNSRTFAAGKRAAERGLEGVPYSRALQAATLHYYRIMCGSDVKTGTFTTATVPLGFTYSEPIPADPDNAGEALWPLLDFADRTKTYIDPQTGVLIRRVSGPADIYSAGKNLPASDLTSRDIDTSPQTGSAWSGTSLPASVSRNNTDYLVLLAHGLRFWPSYPLTSVAQTYSSEAQGNLNWMSASITASETRPACNRNVTDDCKIQVCLSVDRVTCHPWSMVFEQGLTTTAKAYTFGAPTYVNQGGWLKPGHRWLNAPETVDRSGNVTCDGSMVVKGGPFNLAWSPGTPIAINGTNYQIQSIQHEGQITLKSTCPTGTYNFTSTTLAILVRAKAASSNTITISSVQMQWELAMSAQWPAGAHFDVCSTNTVNGAANRPGYTCLIPTAEGFYWVDAETGDTRLIGRNQATPQVSCYQYGSPIDPANPAKFNCYNFLTDHVLTFEYKGNYADRQLGFDFNSESLPNCSSATNPTNTPCYVNTDLIAGTSLTALIQRFDPAYDRNKFACCTQNGTNQLGQLVLSSYRSGQNNSLMWTVIFDPNVSTNKEPGNAGCVSAILNQPTRNGCVVAAIPNWLRDGMRGMPSKVDMTVNPAPGWVTISPMTWATGPYDGLGPWIMKTSGGFQFTTTPDAPGGLNDCPSNPFGVTGKVCTTVTVGSEPFDPDPGPTETGAPGEYFTTQPGDFLYFDNPSGNHDQVHELVRVLVKNGLTLVVQRGAANATAACDPRPIGTCGSGGRILASTVNPVLSVSATAPWTYWNYLNDPHGSNGMFITDQRDSMNHKFSRHGSFVEAYNGTWDPRCTAAPVDGCYGIRLNPALNDLAGMITNPRTGVTTANPGFAGKYGTGSVNNVQSHPGPMGHVPPSPLSDQFFLDGRPYNGKFSAGDPGAPLATKVSGTLWKFPASPNPVALDRKFLPTKAQAGWHPLIDISGPAAAISDGPSDNYTYCVVVAANECRKGSIAGEVYFNVPFLSYNYCLYPGQAGFGADLSDICIDNEAFVADNLVQVGMNVTADNTGAMQRALTKGFAPSRMNAPFWNASTLPNNKWAIFRSRFLNGFRPEVMLMKLPPMVSDGKDRTNFIPLSIPVANVPAGTDNVVVEFGYVENGDADSLFCTSRQETCGAGRGNGFFFTTTEAASLQGVPCASSCTVTVPTLSQHVVYYKIRYRDRANQTVMLTDLQAQTAPY